MPKLITFDDYDAWYEAQARTLGRRGIGPYFTDVEIWKCCDKLRFRPDCTFDNIWKGVCHGARNGLECDQFREHLIPISCFGTDIEPYSGRSGDPENRGESEVIKWDFSMQRSEWIKSFDFVYSNSLDHARDPVVALNIWSDQLVKYGIMFIQWAPGDSEVGGGDCFGASLYEYIFMMNGIEGLKVEDLIYVNVPYERNSKLRRRGNEAIVIVGVKE